MDEEIISSQNHFDRLPDDVLRLILNRVHHAKSLCACLAVSTRFNSIALHSTSVSLSVDRIHFNDDDDDDDDDDVIPSTASSDKHNHHLLLPSLIRFFISTPLRFLTNLLTSRPTSSSNSLFYSPTEALKSFSKIEVLKIQLPSHGELQLDRASNPVLKWKASFGSELKTCVIVAGTSIDQFKKVNDDEERERRDSVFNSVMKDVLDNNTDRGAEPPFVISNEDLKMRVVWTISCLIAASARHHLLKRIVAQHPMLKAIEMVDEHRQGALTMEEADISQMRNSMICISDSDSNPDDEISCSSSTDRTRIPALKMKMWHAAELELPECNKVMRGATLVLIGAADGGGDEVDGGVEGMFDGGDDEMMYGEVTREIRKKMKQSYSLEMESF
ncbi:unnamed protein product [Rhodiola kirilowii]